MDSNASSVSSPSKNSELNPWPVYFVAERLKKYIEELPAVWVEGQVIELNQRATASYITLRDLTHEVSFSVQAWKEVMENTKAPIGRGSRVVMLVKPNYWLKAGRLSMQARLIQAVGLGDLLARIETLRKKLAAEGLFDPDLKKPLPVLPRRIGVITGRNSDAGKDIRRNATLRWPGARFEYREVATQGTNTVPEVLAALQELDLLLEVDVIVIARGGGSLEDLLPFSDENLVRGVFTAKTPVVSAIGHEADNPILDNVADLRASTPTDAAKRIVPHLEEEKERLRLACFQLKRFVKHSLKNETYHLKLLTSSRLFAQPQSLIEERRLALRHQRDGAGLALRQLVMQERTRIQAVSGHIRSLSPQNTLDRGYAIVKNRENTIIRNVTDIKPLEHLQVHVASGSFSVQVK